MPSFLGCIPPGKLSLDTQFPISPSTLFISLLQQWSLEDPVSPATYKLSINDNDPPCYSITLHLIHSESNTCQVTDSKYWSTIHLKYISKTSRELSSESGQGGALERKPIAQNGVITFVVMHHRHETNCRCSSLWLEMCSYTYEPVGSRICFRKLVLQLQFCGT